MIENQRETVTVRDNKKQKIDLLKVETKKNNDYYLKVHSSFKEYKERAMNEQFRERFELGLEKIALSLTKKGGVKQEDKVHQRIGRLKQKYRSIHRYFDIQTDLDLRPIYHKTDQNTMAHLHLGLLAYWAVNTIRFQLKQNQINDSWKEIVRKMNTQKAVTTTAQNDTENIISIRRCSEPNENVKKIYDTLGYKYVPYKRKKSVVHKPKFKKKYHKDFQEST